MNLEKLREYIENNDLEYFDEIIKSNKDRDEIETLSNIRKNILSFYKFKENASLLEIGANFGELTGLFLEKLEKVVAVEEDELKCELIKKRYNKRQNLNVFSTLPIYLNLDERFDYIVISSIFDKTNELEDIIKIIAKAKEHLKNDGTIILIFDNYFGIKRWVNLNLNGKFEFQKEDNIKTLKNIKHILEKNNLKIKNTFYPFPNYKFTDVIFSNKFKPTSENIDRYFPIKLSDNINITDEKKILKKLLKEDKNNIDMFSNSFLLEIQNETECKKNGEEITDDDILFVSFNNYRKEKYRLMTIIKKDVVLKEPVSDVSKEHLVHIINSLDKLDGYNIEVLDKTSNGKNLYSTYLKDFDTLDVLLGEKYDNLEFVVNILNDLKNILLKNSLPFGCVNKEKVESYLKKLDVNEIQNIEEILNKLNYMEYGFWDMVPKNCFLIDDRFYFFDQEWNSSFIPVEFVIYRSVINSYDLVTKINVDELFEKLGILEYIKFFEKIDEMLRNEILDHEMLDFLTTANGVVKVENLIYDKKELDIRNEEINIYKKQINDLMENNKKQDEHIKYLEERIVLLTEKVEINILNKIKNLLKNDRINEDENNNDNDDKNSEI